MPVIRKLIAVFLVAWLSLCLYIPAQAAPKFFAVVANSGGATTSYNFLSGTLDPSLTFTRASNATMYDSTGTLVYAPVNLLVQSNSFTTNWSASNTTITQGVTDPFGGTTAWTLTPSASNGGLSEGFPIIGSTSYTLSLWVKAGTSAQTLTIGWYDGTTFHAIFVSPTSTWTRYSITGVSAASPSGSYAYISNSNGSVAGSFLIYGAQLEPTSYNSPRTYNPTTSAAYYGPRFDYNPSTLALNGLLIEQQSTNILRQSNGFSNATYWTGATAVTITPNNAISPDGTQNATLVTATANTGYFTQALTLSANTTYTFSMWAKNVSGSSLAQFKIFDGANYSTGLTWSTVGSTWTRITRTFTTTGTVTGAYIYFNDTSSSGWSSNLIYGVQLEQTSFATSYIPTQGSTATRLADSLNNTSFTGFNNSAGTFFVEFIPETATGYVTTNGIVSFNDGSSNNRISIRTQPSSASLQFRTVSGSASQYTDVLGATVANTATKVGISYAANSLVYAQDGTILGSESTYTTPTGINTLNIGNETGAGFYSGWIRSISYYNTQLTNAQLQTISGQL